MFKPGNLVKIKKLGLIDTFPMYGQPFKLEEGDICKILVVDFSDEKYPYFLKQGEKEFWISSDTILEKVEEDKKDLEELKANIIGVIKDLNKLLDELDNL